MSKFDYTGFHGEYVILAVSKEKHTKEEAIEIAKMELEYPKRKYLFVGHGYVRHRAGVYEDDGPRVGWWLEYEEHKRSCPCWVFHTSDSLDANFHDEYDVIELLDEDNSKTEGGAGNEAD